MGGDGFGSVRSRIAPNAAPRLRGVRARPPVYLTFAGKRMVDRLCRSHPHASCFTDSGCRDKREVFRARKVQIIQLPPYCRRKFANR